ncbi:hypothetical protein ABT929_004213 [Salmonella enterica subsp. enterica serovar Uganda]|uniref:Phage protein n=4 Tax=Salmonella enterica TaxID=28901 RepID=A0A744MEE6_SALER|nr:hypothetical protein [Salmonella enterica]EAB5862692.1 hypothetical protein [Salmonella enterica subsp. enterica serovar Cairina]EAC1010538.1 hypothetical protein [Salmonella enterica subsp. enterica serovar Jangwani]EBH8226488.1 hypothetical protein [Salmonella enterica subsp. enterica serovar Typhimurium str. UK-1]EBQ6102651.1 hypothetical protein [Salmonella enterica subsp. enterica serovar Ibadan]EBS4170823.1 hypothetical protein [Salmonella enterica subsp. enterica serovar Elisabethvil
MSILRENLTMDLFYASGKAGDANVARITVVVKDASTGIEVHISTLTRTGDEKNATYAVGLQTISDASDPILLKLETYFRNVDKGMFEKYMAKSNEVFKSSLNQGNTWLGQYGLRIASGVLVSEELPESVFA